MHKEVNSKDPLVSWLSALWSFDYRNPGNFDPIEKNKISKSKLGSRLSKTKNISEIIEKAFAL